MKCTHCGQENKKNLRFCRKCNRDLSLPPVWFPDWRWHVRVLSGIYIVLIVGFFTLKFLLKKLPPPYHMRQLPAEMTPWLYPHKTTPP